MDGTVRQKSQTSQHVPMNNMGPPSLESKLFVRTTKQMTAYQFPRRLPSPEWRRGPDVTRTFALLFVDAICVNTHTHQLLLFTVSLWPTLFILYN